MCINRFTHEQCKVWSDCLSLSIEVVLGDVTDLIVVRVCRSVVVDLAAVVQETVDITTIKLFPITFP